MMVHLFYIDASVAIHVMDRTDSRVVAWFNQRMNQRDVVASSALLRLEVTRYLLRLGRSFSDAEDLFSALAFSPVDNTLIREAEAITPYIKTLDTLHLATALRLGDALTSLISDDAKMTRAAQTLGMATYNPLDQAK